MEWLLISSAVFVLILLGVGIYQFLWRNIRDFFREVGILMLSKPQFALHKTSLLNDLLL